jgi:hypothetical protein
MTTASQNHGDTPRLPLSNPSPVSCISLTSRLSPPCAVSHDGADSWIAAWHQRVASPAESRFPAEDLKVISSCASTFGVRSRLAS